MKAYDEYKREFNEEQKKIQINAEELEDFAGSKPIPMDESAVLNVF